MDAFNIVRFRVKPGRKEEFIAAHGKVTADWAGLKHANLVEVGDRAFCLILQWDSQAALTKAGPQLLQALESFRDCLEVLSPKLGIASPLSGPAVLQIK